METTPELIIFFIVGAIAIFSAVMMLISENAVHSALFLVLNFACVAFFYLMLQAAFLAMIQVAVYAGAIMVLFLFVIMLLGAESVAPEANPPYPWMTPVAIVLTTIFLIVAGVGVLNAEISAQTIEPHTPLIQVINAVPGAESVTVTLNDQTIAEDLRFRDESAPQELETGNYNIVIEAHSDAESAQNLSAVLVASGQPDTEATEDAENAENAEDAAAAEGETTETTPTVQITEPNLEIEGGTDMTLVLTLTEDGNNIAVIPVYEDFSTVDVSDTKRTQIVHAAPNYGPVDLANITQADEAPRLLAENIPFGAYSDPIVTREDETGFGLYEVGAIQAAADALGPDDELVVRDVDSLDIFEQDESTNTSSLYVVALPNRPDLGEHPDLLHYQTDNRPMFGGPESIGQLLFTGYMLPFQVIALLLLVAMIGAIVLTRDQVVTQRRVYERRLARAPNTAPQGEPSQD